MQKRTKFKHTALWVAACSFIIFLAGSLVFVLSVRTRNDNSILAYISDAVEQRKSAITRQMRGDFQVMRGVAVAMGEIDLEDDAKVTRILKEVNLGNTFSLMGLSDIRGKVDLVDMEGQMHYGVDISGQDAFYRALDGYESVSVTYYEPRFDAEINFYTVPVRKNDYMVGALCAINNGEILRDILAVPVFQGEGYFGIVDAAGTFVTSTVDPNPDVELGGSVYNVIDAEPDVMEAFKANLGSGQGGQYILTIDGVEYLSATTPLEVNGWMVICVVPHAPLLSYYNQTAVGTVVIIAAACLVFLFLLGWQMRTMAKSQAQLEKLAYTDLLTGIRNHSKFIRDVEELMAKNHGRKFAIWSFDIKRFNYINDMFGSATGDKVLQRVASLLKSQEKPDAFSCRVASDQFAGILPYETTDDLKAWFKEQQRLLSHRQVIPDNRLVMEGAVGMYLPAEFDERLPADDMLSRATIAKKKAKAETGTRMEVFTPDMGRQMRWESELEASGPNALANGELTFFLQPKVNIQQEDFTVVGAEVLARWIHPRHGWISPGEFIPVFERNGFVVELDRFIFEEACKWYVASLKKGLPPIRLSINVSRQGLLREDFIDYYTSTRKKYNIEPDVLELEFTESMLQEDYALFQSSVTDLKDNGFVCSIDDFGSGYSSLNVLRNLSIDVLKLDALFFRESNNTRRGQIMVEGFISMAHRLKIETVAEGIETLDQLDFLQLVGCDIIQGYVFSKPLPKNDFETMMKEGGGAIEPAG